MRIHNFLIFLVLALFSVSCTMIIHTDQLQDGEISSDGGSGDAGSETLETIEIEALSVEAAYPNNGRNWNDYIKNDATDKFSATDTICVGNEANYNDCFNGGFFRKVEVIGVEDCGELTITDSENLFKWRCIDSSGTATFFSYEFQNTKGLKHALNPGSFKSISVSLGGMVGNQPYSGTTSSTIWWNNDVVPLPDNNALPSIPLDGADDGNNDDVFTAGTIFTLETSRASRGYNLNLPKMGIVVFENQSLSYDGAGDSCTTAAEDGAGLRCLISARGDYFLWLEGEFDGYNGAQNTERNIFFNQVHYSHFHQVYSKNSDDYGIDFFQGESNRFTDSASSNHANHCFRMSDSDYSYMENFHAEYCTTGVHMNNSQRNTYVNINMANNSAHGFRVVSTSSNHVFQGLLATNNPIGVMFDTSPHSDNFITGLTGVNNSGDALNTGSMVNSTFSHIVAVNQDTGIQADSGTDNTLSNIALVSNTSYGIRSSDNNLKITGTFLVGNNGDNCDVTGGTNPGIIDSLCTDFGNDGDTDYTGQFSDALYRENVSADAAFIAEIDSSDTSNSSENSDGDSTFPGAPETFDWLNFENFYRSWGHDDADSALPAAWTNGEWSGPGDGSIWDYRLRAADTEIRNTTLTGNSANQSFSEGATCPTAVHGNETSIDRSSIPVTYLISAWEILNDDIGNENGLCENDEHCLYAPNYGAYQGHGDLLECEFDDDNASTAIQNVTMFGYSQNGI